MPGVKSEEKFGGITVISCPEIKRVLIADKLVGMTPEAVVVIPYRTGIKQTDFLRAKVILRQ